MPDQDLQRELVTARAQTDSLFQLISPDAIYDRPVAERHRLIFYLGHFEAFDWNVLGRKALGAPAFHPEFDKLFERGIDPPPGQTPQDTVGDWPTRSEVAEYNLKTRQWIDSHLQYLDSAVLQMVVEHRQMHAETFAYLMHGLPYEKKLRAPAAFFPARPAPENPMIKIRAGQVTLGQAADAFGWDNEHAAHQLSVPAFTISKFKVSNGEYLNFVRAGGPVPHFWCKEGDAWFFRGMFARIPLRLDQPVWVTLQQAAGFAQWRGLSLPSEAQFVRAAALSTADAARDNFGFTHWDPIPVDAGHEHTNGHAPVQMTGNGWEWTGDVFKPFEGFEAHPFYPGYSADFFDGRHYVMKGASPRTAVLLTRPSFRNWFRPDYPHMYAGFRLVGL